MRANALSLAVIVVALAAIAAGYAGGRSVARPPAIAVVPGALPSRAPHLRDAIDERIDDVFSRDAVVVDRASAASMKWLPERLSVVVGLCGESAPIDATFLRAGLPFAFDLDPHAGDAVRSARLVRSQHALLLVHLSGAPSAQAIAALRARLGAFDGIASRTSAGMAEALRGTNLMFFDERGDANAAPFRANGVAIVSRDTTVDDRGAKSYVRFMLERAALRSSHEGRLVVLMRPLPDSLAALESFLATRSTQIVPLTQDEH
jgi:hypothetical protein